MSDDVPKQIAAEFTMHGMDARFKARAPREARILAVAMAVGIAMPMVPVAGLIAVGTWWPEHVNEVFAPLLVGIVLTLLAQTTAGPLLFNWAGKPAEVALHLDEHALRWEREGDRIAFALENISDIEAMSGEIRVEAGPIAHRMPCSGLKKEAVDWLEARMKEAWQARRAKMAESATDRAQRRKIGALVPQD